MAFKSGGPDADIVDINVTPLVDITLVLLLVFMVTAKLVMSQALPMDLPAAATAGEVQTVLSVAVDAAGNLTVDGAALQDASALEGLARRARLLDPEVRVVVAASERVAHGSVVRVLDALRTAGLSKIAFAAEKRL